MMVSAASGSHQPTVWVTRPQPGNDATCERVREIGLRPVSIPLSQTRSLNTPLGLIQPHDIVTATSAAAIRAISKQYLPQLQQCAFYAVGEATAQAARNVGFNTVFVADGDAATLGKLLVEQTSSDDHIHYLAGRTRTGSLEAQLESNGRNVTLHELYSVEKVSCTTHIREYMTCEITPDFILFHAEQSVRFFEHDLLTCKANQIIENTRFICISDRVAKALSIASSSMIYVAAQPDEQSMLAALHNLITPIG